MTIELKIKVGDTYWRGMGLRNGRDVDDATSPPCQTEEDAIAAIHDEWFSWLSDREQQQSEVYARQFRCLQLDDDGEIGIEETV